MTINEAQWDQLASELDGELHRDSTMRTVYATDASAYRELPLAVAVPRSRTDLKKLIAFAQSNRVPLIPRTAGTSLAGQVVGNGIVVDVSRHFTRIIELNEAQRWVLVEPGVIRDELNVFLKPYGLFFGPETSTANRAMIGGMVGNNSCGSNSIVYRSTREHVLQLDCLLSDGTEASFSEIDIESFHAKCELGGREGDIYRTIRRLLSNHENRLEIEREFPKRSIERRNTGYALDLLARMAPFEAGGPDFDFCQLLTGSEGTLAFITAIRLRVVPLPPPVTGLLCVHFNSVDEALRANLIALRFAPSASELIDHYILECTKDNIEQRRNRFFVQGDPGAILVVEFQRETMEEVQESARLATEAMRSAGFGYHFPLLTGEDTKKIWTLRKAGLGLLSNLPGDEKAVPVIEDTAVDVNDLPDYIRDFNDILRKHNLYSVHYAHAGSGELHLRPIINLKTVEGNRQFRTIAQEIARLVKKYRGSLSGEHGDGRLRGEFIREMVGERNYQMMRLVKQAWDPHHIFNPGKIVDTPPMDTMLRYDPGHQAPAFRTTFRFHDQDILQHAEQCNGSGDCRKTHLSGGTMCPSYMATRDEKDTTRARANVLREFLTRSTKANRFDHREIYEVMDLCLSCKACKSECPSNVDMAKLKAEFLQQYYDANGVPFRAKLIANFTRSAALASRIPAIYNALTSAKATGRLIKQLSGFAAERSLPRVHGTTVRQWFRRQKQEGKGQKVYFFCDEFTNYNDTPIGIKAVQLLLRLGYHVIMPDFVESGRTWLSKGLIRRAREIANRNVAIFSQVLDEDAAIVGLEPSAILCFRDEYPDLVSDEWLERAKALAKRALMFEEFIVREATSGRISRDLFHEQSREVLVHGHCQQKAVSSVNFTREALSLPRNYSVRIIPSGCCGMAGSFGYEKEHYDISMKIGELVLFPAVREASGEVIVAAPGTSCRHQIKDGTGRVALHPVEILFDALKRDDRPQAAI